MVRLLDVVGGLFRLYVLGVCIAFVSGAVVLSGGVGAGVKNCWGSGVSLCISVPSLRMLVLVY